MLATTNSNTNIKPSLFTDHEDYVTGRGVKIKIYAAPTQIIMNMSTPYDKEKPKRPVVTMKTKGGEQKRAIKKGDEGWDEYKELLDEWEQKCNDFREAVSYVSALEDQVYPDPLNFSGKTQKLIDQKLVSVPENEWEAKMFWLRDRVLGQHDEMQIAWIMRRLSGVPKDVIEQQKARFWDILSGKKSRTVEDGDIESTGEQEEDLADE